MQERRAGDALHGPLVVEMEGVAGDDRLVRQYGGFVLAAIIRDGLLRQYGRISQVRTAKDGSNRVSVGILTVEKTVGGIVSSSLKPNRSKRPFNEAVLLAMVKCGTALKFLVTV